MRNFNKIKLKSIVDFEAKKYIEHVKNIEK